MNTNVLFTGELLNDGRVAGILHRWDNGEIVDPPTVCFSARTRIKLSISDGRHRTKIAFLLGVEFIPVAIHYGLGLCVVGAIRARLPSP
jgi:hypothetical protein